MNIHQHRGRVWKFGDDVDTGQIIPGQYIPLTDPHELAKHAMEAVAPDFAGQVKPGDVIVAGRNFGCGSSREHAAKALKYAGVSAVLADSFARIFFRNAFNVGLAAIPLENAGKLLLPGQQVELDIPGGTIRVLDTGQEIKLPPLPGIMLEILEAGGIIPYTIKAIGQ